MTMLQEIHDAVERRKQYDLRVKLITQYIEEYHGDPEAFSARNTATEILKVAYGEVNECYYCGNIGLDVNRYAHYHVGGVGEVSERCCDNGEECAARVDKIN